ncbi:Do family serine endopeptidase [Massilia sp. PWRC2]|uniref:Do family serine endopeptidase n=1 Tax=Massilia sp. PWRC2 TaxID=2804626 RepID=UPI003CE76117
MTTDHLARRTIISTLLSTALSAALALAPAAPAFAAAAPVATPVVTGLPDFTDLIDKVGPAVVNIRTTEKIKAGQGQPGEEEMQEFLRRFFGQGGQGTPGARNPRRRAPQPEQEIQRGIGSGFVISADGLILTNAHVVEGADDVIVTLTDRRELKAKVLGADKRTDVAVLKVDGANMPFLRIGDSNKIRVGEWVIAIGSPFNLENSVTAGIISAKARDTGDYLPLIQSDVAVNPGNSGGPLINMRGEVVGINSQIATLSGGYNGISFAVPIDEAIRVSDQLRKSGKVARGRLGVQIGEVSKDVAESLGMGRARGAEVSLVEAGGPADKAGIRTGDIILKFNGTAIEKSADLPRQVGASTIGSKASVTVWRKGQQVDIPVTIALLEEDKAAAKPVPKKPKAEAVANALGLHVSNLTDAQKKDMKIDGVLVDAAEGAAAQAGVSAGDMILQINNVEVKEARQFNELVAKLDPKKPVALLVRRDNPQGAATTAYLVIRPRS